MPADLARVVRPTGEQPWRVLWHAIRADGWLAPAVLVMASVLAAAGIVVEALWFRALIDIHQVLGVGPQRLTALGLVIAFLASVAVLDLASHHGLRRLGRHLEASIRRAYRLKIPRVSDLYFRSRLTSDLAERGHSLADLRRLPRSAGDAVRSVLLLAAWWVLGRGVLHGRFDPGWFAAWTLVLLTMAPAAAFAAWWKGLLGVGVVGLLNRRLLRGCQELPPEAIRTEGSGKLLARVLESQGLADLSLGTGLGALGAVFDLGFAAVLLALLSGLRSPDTGLVLLDGLDGPTLGRGGWRRRVAAAPQFHENHVFTATLAYNVLMGRHWPPDDEDLDEARQVLRELGLGELLERMPSGISQMVGESGWRLSHGERSRVFVARALLQGADLLLFDESFGALDPRTLRARVLSAPSRRRRPRAERRGR